MRLGASIAAAALARSAVGCSNPNTDACAGAVLASAAGLADFCASYTTAVVKQTTALPAMASACGYHSHKLSSACSCFVTAAGAAPATTLATQTAVPTKTKHAGAGSVTATGSCTVTEYADIAAAVKSCKTIVLSNISAPPSSTIDLQKLQTGAVVTFAGKTTFGTTPSNDFDPIIISGNGITITGAPGHIIDGNGPAYWDGQGSNGGRPKPDHFIVVKKATNSFIRNLYIKNWPVHLFSMTRNEHLTVSNLTLDNSDGDAPNELSKGKPAAHNSDGFDISGSDYVTVEDIWVHNQDDCVAVTSGTHITINRAYCYGGHGLSIGSVGGKSNNTVDTILFSNSQIVDSENGARIKTNSGKTGSVKNVTYQNIVLSNITRYGIDVQQDYLNGGPTGKPTSGVPIENIRFVNVTGTVNGPNAYNYYILCGTGACSDISFSQVSVTGGGKQGSCNYPSSGCP